MTISPLFDSAPQDRQEGGGGAQTLVQGEIAWYPML